MTVHAIFGGFFVLTGCAVLAWTVLNCISAQLSHGWSQASGTIVVAELRRAHGVDGGYLYRAHVSYRYFVSDRELIASRVRFGDRIQLSWRRPAARIIKRYPVGAAVSVSYDRNDPTNAVLEPGVNALLLGWTAFGAVFTAIGVVAILA